MAAWRALRRAARGQGRAAVIFAQALQALVVYSDIATGATGASRRAPAPGSGATHPAGHASVSLPRDAENTATRVQETTGPFPRHRGVVERAPRTAASRQCNKPGQEIRAVTSQYAATHGATLAPSELAGKLVRHQDNYKLVVDTLRILIANIVADLATTLGPFLSRPAEAKKTLDNLVAAPAVIHATHKLVIVELAPAGTRNELAAFIEMLRPINARKLSLPGDRPVAPPLQAPTRTRRAAVKSGARQRTPAR